MFGFLPRKSRLPAANSRRASLAFEVLEGRENPAGMPWTGAAPVSVSSASVTEGNVATFVVTPAVGHPVIDAIYQTADGSASGSDGPDYQIVAGQLHRA